MNLYNRVQSMHGHDWGFEQIDGEELIADIGQTADVMVVSRLGEKQILILIEDDTVIQVLSLEDVDVTELNQFVFEFEARVRSDKA